TAVRPAVRAEPVGAQGVHGDQHEVLRLGRRSLRAAAAEEDEDGRGGEDDRRREKRDSSTHRVKNTTPMSDLRTRVREAVERRLRADEDGVAPGRLEEASRAVLRDAAAA